MIHSQPLIRVRTAVLLSILGILVVSCGSYQQASYYDNDGIYEEDNVRVVEKAPQQVRQKRRAMPTRIILGKKLRNMVRSWIVKSLPILIHMLVKLRMIVL